jgi:hypothetical protein
MNMDTNGLLFLVLDDLRYVAMTYLSLSSLRRAGNKDSVTVVTNLPADVWIGQEELCYSLAVPEQIGRAGMDGIGVLKTQILDYSPYRRTLLVDSDILFLGNISDVWSGSEEISLALDPYPTFKDLKGAVPRWFSVESWEETLRVAGQDAYHYNVGVLRVDKTANTRALFAQWSAEINRFPKPDVDQIAFIRALRASNVSVQLMSQEYNLAFMPTHLERKTTRNTALVLHFNGMDPEERNRAMLKVYAERFPPKTNKP